MTLTTLRSLCGRDRTAAAPATCARGRGQSLTEFALLLPVLLLLVVVALDFGRIYLGYINVQNMARIAANEAANNPLAWSVTVDESIQERYRKELLEDSSATNCVLPTDGAGDPIVPDPIFTDMNADGTDVGLGDKVTVQLTCTFSVATPILGAILGGSVPVTAESDFPVKAGMTAVLDPGVGGGGGGGGGVTAPPTSSFIANNSVVASASGPYVDVVGPTVTVSFADSSGGGPATEWAWDFGDGATSASQDAAHEYQCTAPDAAGYCYWVVTMVASNIFGSGDPTYVTVRVRGESDINFVADRQVIDRGQSITFTDTSTPGGVDFAWTFGDGGSVSGAADQVSYTYSTVGTFTVTLTVTYPAPVGAAPTATKVGFITVNAGYCTVPSLTNVRFNEADAIWQGAPYSFTGAVRRATGAPIGNFKITAQSIAAGNGATALCNSDVYVSAP